MNADLSKNIKLHLGVESRQLENMIEMNRLLKSARQRGPRLPTKKDSATLRGVC